MFDLYPLLPHPLPSGYHHMVICVYEFLFVFLVCSFVAIRIISQRPKYKISNNKLHKDSIGTKLMDLGLREDYMNLTPKAREVKAKISEWDYISNNKASV